MFAFAVVATVFCVCCINSVYFVFCMICVIVCTVVWRYFEYIVIRLCKLSLSYEESDIFFDQRGEVSGSGSQVCEILGDLRYSLPTSLSQCIYMSRGLVNELLVTWAVLVTLDVCSAQDPVLSRHNQFSVMHI